MATPPTLQYPTNVPPVAVLAAARIGGVDLKVVPEKEWLNAAAPTLTFEGGAKLSGIASLLRYVARCSPASLGLYGTDHLTSTLVVPVCPSPLPRLANRRRVDQAITISFDKSVRLPLHGNYNNRRSKTLLNVRTCPSFFYVY